MSRAHGLFLSFVALLAPAGCAPRPEAGAQPVASPTPAEDDYPKEILGELTADMKGDEPFRRGGYELVKRVREETLPSGYTERTEYAVLKKDGRRVARFASSDEDLGGAHLRFGVFSLLGPQSEQLIVEQSVHRRWRIWVVDLAQDARVVFDNADYPVGHELRAKDLDGDGRFELLQSLHTFWFFNDKINNVNSPLIDIIFKYDAKARRYVPANHEFQEFALRDVERLAAEARRQRAKGGPDFDLFGPVLQVVVTYLYAGKESEGWEFFEEYDLPDKEAMRADIKEALAGDRVYAAVRKSARDEARAAR